MRRQPNPAKDRESSHALALSFNIGPRKQRSQYCERMPMMLAPVRRLPSADRQFSPSTQIERENHEQN